MKIEEKLSFNADIMLMAKEIQKRKRALLFLHFSPYLETIPEESIFIPMDDTPSESPNKSIAALQKDIPPEDDERRCCCFIQ